MKDIINQINKNNSSYITKILNIMLTNGMFFIFLIFYSSLSLSVKFFLIFAQSIIWFVFTKSIGVLVRKTINKKLIKRINKTNFDFFTKDRNKSISSQDIQTIVDYYLYLPDILDIENSLSGNSNSYRFEYMPQVMTALEKYKYLDYEKVLQQEVTGTNLYLQDNSLEHQGRRGFILKYPYTLSTKDYEDIEKFFKTQYAIGDSSNRERLDFKDILFNRNIIADWMKIKNMLNSIYLRDDIFYNDITNIINKKIPNQYPNAVKNQEPIVFASTFEDYNPYYAKEKWSKLKSNYKALQNSRFSQDIKQTVDDNLKILITHDSELKTFQSSKARHDSEQLIIKILDSLIEETQLLMEQLEMDKVKELKIIDKYQEMKNS